MEEKVKKTWEKPKLSELDIKLTQDGGGFGGDIAFQEVDTSS